MMAFHSGMNRGASNAARRIDATPLVRNEWGARPAVIPYQSSRPSPQDAGYESQSVSPTHLSGSPRGGSGGGHFPVGRGGCSNVTRIPESLSARQHPRSQPSMNELLSSLPAVPRRDYLENQQQFSHPHQHENIPHHQSAANRRSNASPQSNHHQYNNASQAPIPQPLNVQVRFNDEENLRRCQEPIPRFQNQQHIDPPTRPAYAAYFDAPSLQNGSDGYHRRTSNQQQNSHEYRRSESIQNARSQNHHQNTHEYNPRNPEPIQAVQHQNSHQSYPNDQNQRQTNTDYNPAPRNLAPAIQQHPSNQRNTHDYRRDPEPVQEAPQQRSYRYDDRRQLNNDNGGNQQKNDDSTRKRAPKDYAPMQRPIEEIYQQDISAARNYGDSIFNGDAEIEVEGQIEIFTCPTWESMELNPRLLYNIRKSEYTKPRNIQQYVIPYILDGNNVKIQSETGSGKTAAFLIPLINMLINEKQHHDLPTDGPLCLILSNSRELTQQTYEQAKKFTDGTGITVAAAYGEYAESKNLADIKRGCNIICACLGRLLAFADYRHFSLEHVRYLVIDEADKFVEYSKETSQLLKLLNNPDLPNKTQRKTYLLSATLKDPKLDKIVFDHVDHHRCISIISKSQSNKRIKYELVEVPLTRAKFRYLNDLLNGIKADFDGYCPRTLIFVNKKVNVDKVAMECAANGFPATTIHSDRPQNLREEALQRFRSGRARVLVTTDVCSRGLDIQDIEYVINYDLPFDKNTYIHRCGRIGRIHDGVAVSFYCEETDANMLEIVENVIIENNQPSPFRAPVRYMDEENVQTENAPIQHDEPLPPTPSNDEQVIPDAAVDDDWD